MESYIGNGVLNIIVYDFEIFMYNWMVVFKELPSNEYKIIVDDTNTLKKYVTENIGKRYLLVITTNNSTI